MQTARAFEDDPTVIEVTEARGVYRPRRPLLARRAADWLPVVRVGCWLALAAAAVTYVVRTFVK